MISIITAFEVINQGISVFKFLNQSDATTQRAPSTVEDVTHMLSASTAAITEVIQTGNAHIIDKLERDKMETLSSRIGNLEMLLRMGERDRLFNYLLTVQESVDYARNRYLEGKPQWFVPYLSGRSVVLASFSHLGNIDQTSMRALQSEIKVEMHKLLDQVVERCVAHQIAIPWEEVESVLTLSDGGISRLIERLTPHDTFSQVSAQRPEVTFDAPAELIIEPKATPAPLSAPVTPVPLTPPPARHANLTPSSHHVAAPAPHAQRAASLTC